MKDIFGLPERRLPKMSRSPEQVRKVHDIQGTLSSSLGPLIDKFRVDDLPDVKDINVEGALAITGCDSIASYNWMEDDNTIITVPGIGLTYLCRLYCLSC